MQLIVPPRLQAGDTVRVIAPAGSRAMVMEHDHTAVIEERFSRMGLRMTYGRYVDEQDPFDSSSIASRVSDLHEAFSAPEIAAVLTVIGGYNSNELLPHVDWALVAANPKIFCGYSDITALQAAIFARTGLVTYSGPHWSSFGMRDHFEQTQQWFTEALFQEQSIQLSPASTWTDDAWFLDQDARTPRAGEGWWVMQPGEAVGRLLGGNLCTLNLLQGTEYMPDLSGALLFLEDDEFSKPENFARNLTSLLQQPMAHNIAGLVIGRFQVGSRMTGELLREIVDRQPRLREVPVLANVDFGHTFPAATLPIGGHARLIADRGEMSVVEVSSR